MLLRPSSLGRIPSPLLLLSLLPLSDAFFFGNSGCGCQLLPPPPPLPVLDTCACRKEERDHPVFREPPTLPFMPLQQSSIYYAPPPAASPTYYSAPQGPVIAREYIPVSSYQTSPVGFQSGKQYIFMTDSLHSPRSLAFSVSMTTSSDSGTFPIGQDSGVSYRQPSFSRRPQFAFQRQERLNRYQTSSYALPPLQPPSLPPPIVLPPFLPSFPSPSLPIVTPPPADWPGWTTQPPPPPPPPRPTPPPSDWVTQPPSNPYQPWPATTPAPADWPGWTTQQPPPPPPPRPTPPPSDWVPPSNPYNPRTTTQPPADFPGWTTQPPPPPPPPTTTQPPFNPYWTTTPPPQDFITTTQPPPPPPPPPTSPYKPWNPYQPQNQIYSVNDIVVDVMRPPPNLARFPPGFQDEVRDFRKKRRMHKKLVKKV